MQMRVYIVVHRQEDITSSGGFIAYKKGNIGNMAAFSEDHYRVSDCEAEERLYYIFPGYNTKHFHNLHFGVAQWTDPFSIISCATLCKTGRGKNAFQRRAKAHYVTCSGSSSRPFSSRLESRLSAIQSVWEDDGWRWEQIFPKLVHRSTGEDEFYSVLWSFFA